MDSGKGIKVELMAINGHDVSVDTGTDGVISFVSGAYVATAGGSVDANVVQIDGENVHSDGNGRLRVQAATYYDTGTDDFENFPAGFKDFVSGGGSGGVTVEEIDAQLSATHGGGEWGFAPLSGGRTVTITVTDGDNPIFEAKVRVASGAESECRLTDSNGQVTFNLDDGTWTVAITKSRYSFSGAELVVDGDVAAEYELTPMTITPSEPGLTTGFLICRDKAGAPQSGVSMSLCLITGVGGGTAFSTEVYGVTSDLNGLAEFPGLYKGGKYKLYREGSSETATSVTVPSDAGDTYELPSVKG